MQHNQTEKAGFAVYGMLHKVCKTAHSLEHFTACKIQIFVNVAPQKSEADVANTTAESAESVDVAGSESETATEVDTSASDF